MAFRELVALAFFVVTASHLEGGTADPARRLTFANDLEHIWGGPAQCSDHLSDGPLDADVEVRLAGLPPSTSGAPVHMQWWSPRKSPTEYDPLTSPVNSSVYSCLIYAYPKYSDADFNGGNVPVSEGGGAVIRIRAPSTYFVWRMIAVPHIHLRFCRGASTIEKAADAIMLGDSDIWVSSAHRNITIVSANPFVGPNDAVSPPSTAEVPPVGFISGVRSCPCNSTAMLPSTTTVAPITTTTQAEASQHGVLISTARDALDLDALEFSPVYQCLLERRFYDHFSAGCVQSCPASSAVAHGQCVRADTADPRAQVRMSWELEVDCGEPCWHDKKNATLHGLRLSFAGHLDLPFQEVEVSVGLVALSGRRLAGARSVYLTVKVDSNRISATQGNSLLASYPQDAATMTTLLGLEVLAVHSHAAPGQTTESSVMGQGNDPYVPAYSEIENVPKTSGPAPPNSVVSLLPTEAIIGIAAGVVVLAAIVGGLLWRRQRQRRAAARAQQAKSAEKKVEETDAAADANPSAV